MVGVAEDNVRFDAEDDAVGRHQGLEQHVLARLEEADHEPRLRVLAREGLAHSDSAA